MLNINEENNILIKAIKAKFDQDGKLNEQTQIEVEKVYWSFFETDRIFLDSLNFNYD